MSKSDKTLAKCEELTKRLNTLKQALNAAAPEQPRRTLAKGLGIGWSQDTSTGSFFHDNYGMISMKKHADGSYNIFHDGKIVGVGADPQETGVKIKRHVEALEKGNYGKFQGGSEYSEAANAKRKANNVGDVAGEGPNVNVKAFSTKPGQLSAKQSANKEAKQLKALNRKQPVRKFTPAEIAAIEEANKLKKNAEGTPWMSHSNIPNADDEVQKIQRTNPAIPGENVISNQLANMMMGKSMLNPNHRQPTSEDMIMAGERMGLGANQEMLKSADEQWANTHNNWLAEAMKPISARFSSEAEEAAYWDSIRVTGGKKEDDYGF